MNNAEKTNVEMHYYRKENYQITFPEREENQPLVIEFVIKKHKRKVGTQKTE